MTVEEAWAGTETAFHDYGCPLTNVSVFNYLGRILKATYKDWSMVV